MKSFLSCRNLVNLGKPESQRALSTPWRNQTGTVLATSWKSFAMRHIKPTLIVLGHQFSRRVKLLSCWEIRAVYMRCSICLNKVLWMLVLVIGCIYIYISIIYIVSNGSMINHNIWWTNLCSVCMLYTWESRYQNMDNWLFCTGKWTLALTTSWMWNAVVQLCTEAKVSQWLLPARPLACRLAEFLNAMKIESEWIK